MKEMAKSNERSLGGEIRWLIDVDIAAHSEAQKEAAA